MKNTIKVMICTAVMGVSISAIADGYYIAIGANENAVRKDEHIFIDIKESAANTVYKLKNEGIGINLAVGKRTGKFSNEVGIERLGDLKWKNKESSFKINKISHIYYDGYYYMPMIIPKCEVFGKGGIGYTSEKFNNITTQGFTLNYGIGIETNFNKVKTRISYTKVVPNTVRDNLNTFTDNIGIDILVNVG